jgi:hypothetical protein
MSSDTEITGFDHTTFSGAPTCHNSECGICEEAMTALAVADQVFCIDTPLVLWGLGSPQQALSRISTPMAGSLYLDHETCQVHVFDGATWLTTDEPVEKPTPPAEEIAAQLAQSFGELRPDLQFVANGNTVTITTPTAVDMIVTCSVGTDAPPLIDVRTAVARPNMIIPRQAGETWGDFAKRVGHGPPGREEGSWLQRLRVLAGET